MIREAKPQQFDIHWQDRFAEPKVKPNPNYPDGINVDESAGAGRSETTEVTIEDRGGKMHVFLSPDGDHIVTKFIDGPGDRKWETTLPHGEWAWHRAVMRASCAVVFL